MHQHTFARRFFMGCLIFLCFSTVSFAQSYHISGVLQDSAKTPLAYATIFIESVKDSSVVDYTITNGEGEFELQGKSKVAKVDFYVAYTGFQTYHRQLSFLKNETFDLGVITLKSANNALSEVIIEGEAPPIRIKEDTLEFNASSFNTKADATLEDLLEKLPGVTVDNQGVIKVNGKEVTEIKINGESFFGGDPKIATKNLPKDIIEKIQVVDSKTEAQEFTGEESESENKAINLVIKEENNKGFFARLTAGGGTDHRYSLNGIANYFKGDMRVSVLGSSNNINTIGFSFDEIYDAMGRSAFSVISRGQNGNLVYGGGGGGITKSQAAGFDFVNKWGEKMELSADYFYNRASTRTESRVKRENILPDRRYYNISNSRSKQVNNNHRGNVSFEYQPDSLTRIVIHPNITVNKGYSSRESDVESTELDGTRINNSTRQENGEVNSVDFSNWMSVTRKFGDKGGYYSLEFENNNSTQNNKQFNYTSRNIYDDNGNLVNNDVQDQYIDKDQSEDEYNIEAEVRLPLTENLKLDIEYEYTNTTNSSKRLIYENGQNGNYTMLNTALSSDFSSKSYHHEPSIGLVYENDKLYASLSGGFESIRLKNHEQFTDTYFDNTYNNFFGRFYARYKIDRMKTLSLYARNSRSIPSLMQLQPVTDKLNPLHIITGNPNLTPTMTNQLSLRYYNFDFKNNFGTYAYLGGRYSTDQVVSKTVTDDDLVRTTTYTNVDGTYGLYGAVGVHKKYTIGETGTLKPKVGVRADYNKYIGFSNGVKYNSKDLSVGPRLSLEYDIPDVITIEPSYRISYNQASYSLSDQPDQRYANHDVRLRITTYLPENFFFSNDVTYTHLGETAPGFEDNYVLWNMSLGYKIWDGDGIFKVQVFDVLDQNVSTRRSIGQNYIQDTQQLVLERYMMFSFTYKLSKFAGKKSKSTHFRRG